jgi:uncharacterized protein YfkK (UPF0435 family)
MVNHSLQPIDPYVCLSIPPSDEQQDYICPIGFIYMRNPVQTPCQHIFESVCLNMWLLERSTCPIDRSHITKEQVVLQTDLQKEIQNYLILHPEQNDESDYNKLIEKYQLVLQRKKFFFLKEGLIRESSHWRNSMTRTYMITFCFLAVISCATAYYFWTFTRSNN